MRSSSISRRGFTALIATAALVLVAPSSSGAAPAESGKVTQSRDAAPGAYPSQVALLNPDVEDNFDAQFCGATYILPGWVLTAAHCFEDPPEAPDVLLGTNVLDGSGTRVSSAEVIVHPDYVEAPDGLTNDIALIRLSAPVAGVPFQRLVVPGLQFLENPGPAVVIGWGGLNPNDTGEEQENAQTLQEGDVPVITDETCLANLAAHDSTMSQPPLQVCAGIGTIDSDPEVADACQGDSGGPLLVPVPGGGFRQAGIVSYGPTCGRSPSVYASVVGFIDFVESTTGLQVATFADIPGDTHEANIERIAHFGVTAGNDQGLYAPIQAVNRGQMATFIGRALQLTPRTDADAFSDIAGNTHRGFINALAAAGVAGGFSDGTFRPNEPVNRGQMATFIGRALELTPLPDDNRFSDIEGNTHEGFINALAADGIAGGFSDGTYQPGNPVFRNQMASFLARGFYDAPRA